MIRGSAQRKRKAQGREPDVQHIEQAGIFDGEKLCQPTIADIVDREPRLKAGEPERRNGKARRRAAKLLRIGNIFGIVDRDQLAANEGQSGIKRARLGARQPRRYDDDLAVRRSVPQHRESLNVPLFKDELHIEFGAWISQRIDRCEQLRHDPRFTMKRDNERIKRQIGIRQRRGPRHRGDEAGGAGRQTQPENRKEYKTRQRRAERCGLDRRKRREERDETGRHGQGEKLRLGHAVPRTEAGIQGLKRKAGGIRDFDARRSAGETRKMRRRGDRKILEPIGLPRRGDQRRNRPAARRGKKLRTRPWRKRRDTRADHRAIIDVGNEGDITLEEADA